MPLAGLTWMENMNCLLSAQLSCSLFLPGMTRLVMLAASSRWLAPSLVPPPRAVTRYVLLLMRRSACSSQCCRKATESSICRQLTCRAGGGGW